MRYLSLLKKENLKNKVVLLRLDFNTEDDWRMKASLSTIKFLRARCHTLLILSHKGRPNGFEKGLSLRKDAKRLSRLLHKKIGFFGHFDFPKIGESLRHSARQSIFVLENLRFLPGEAENDRVLAKQLAGLGDIYVNDAFAVSHRANASVVAITNFLPALAGLEMEAEVKSLSRVIKKAKRPLVMIFGGAKASDKLGTMKKFGGKADAFLMGGILANTLLKVKGVDIGSSRIEKNALGAARSIMHFKGLMLPVDYKVKDGVISDIGPKTTLIYSEYLKRARTVVWNGPMGVTENPHFRRGTRGIARAIAKNRRCFSVVGGGETIMALKRMRMDRKMGFVSTGGGAMLAYLAGKKMPGIEALKQTK